MLLTEDNYHRLSGTPDLVEGLSKPLESPLPPDMEHNGRPNLQHRVTRYQILFLGANCCVLLIS